MGMSWTFLRMPFRCSFEGPGTPECPPLVLHSWLIPGPMWKQDQGKGGWGSEGEGEIYCYLNTRKPLSFLPTPHFPQQVTGGSRWLEYESKGRGYEAIFSREVPCLGAVYIMGCCVMSCSASYEVAGYMIWDKLFDFCIPPPFNHYQLPDLALSACSQFPHL